MRVPLLYLFALEVGLEVVELALLAAVPDVGDDLFGRERKVALHHPVV